MKKLIFLSVLAFSFNTLADVKDGYHLFSPVPRHLQREFEPERPDKTRNAYTIDAGHFQAEVGIGDLSKNTGEAETFQLFQTLLRLGITNKVEIQVQPDIFVKSEDKKGFGNTFFAYKYNFFGNDSGKWASAFIPYAIAPTSGGDVADKRWEGGISFPFDYVFHNGSQLEFMFEVNNIRGDQSLVWQTNHIQSISYSYPLTEDLKGYIELYNEMGMNKEERNNTTFDLALGYEVTENLMIDTGAFFGLSHDADNFEYFAGASYHF